MSVPIVDSGPDVSGPAPRDWQRLLPLFREINDLKRIRAPGVQPSVAGARFRTAAVSLFHSAAATEKDVRRDIAFGFTGNAIASTRLAAISIDDLVAGGMTRPLAGSVFQRAIEERRELLDPELFDHLCRSVDRAADPASHDATHGASVDDLIGDGQGSWVDRLIAQPRAGATAPGQPRIVLEPVESCAEHCFVTAVYAALLAPFFGASVEDAFAIGMAHHLHNARLPDAGFAGEALIGDALDDLIATLREAVLAQMHPSTSERLVPLFAQIAGVDTPLARTFHTADTVDRVLQIEYFARSNRFTLKMAMVDMELVHAGPVQAFQHAQLESAGLGPS